MKRHGFFSTVNQIFVESLVNIGQDRSHHNHRQTPLCHHLEQDSLHGTLQPETTAKLRFSGYLLSSSGSSESRIRDFKKSISAQNK
jgi:hypothetical protein